MLITVLLLTIKIAYNEVRNKYVVFFNCYWFNVFC